MEWINPHSWIHIDVAGPDGTVTNWMIECGSPNIMLRRGFTKHSLEVGHGNYQCRATRPRTAPTAPTAAASRSRTARKLFVGGSNPDIPDDKK